MIDFNRLHFSKDVAIRMLADAVMVNVALIAALAVRYLYMVGFESLPAGMTPRDVLVQYSAGYRNSALLLTALSLGIFFLSGLYANNRTHRIRYKAFNIAQGVTLSYLLFGFFSYFFSGALDIPRGALVVGWLGTFGLMLTSRFWSGVWRRMVREEDATTPTQSEDIEDVLVIGGAGYIGSALLPKLLDEGYNVRLLDLLLYGTEPISDVIDHENLEIMREDFRHSEKVVQAMKGMDAVIHLGAIVGDPACEVDEDATIEINLAATRMIAAVAKAADIDRFIFASTCSVYGAADEMLDERSVLRPVSLYARSKIASERVLRDMADESFRPTFLRFGTIYGLSGRTRFDLVVNLLTAKAKNEGEITIYGGDQWRPFLHVDDAGLGILKALQAPPEIVGNEIFNVGSNEQNYTIDQIGEIINDIVPEAEIVYMGEDSDDRDYRVSFDKIRNQLTFLPQWTVEEGVDQVVEAIDDGTVTDYEDPKYSNVKYLTQEAEADIILDKHAGWARQLIDDTGNVQTPLQDVDARESDKFEEVG